MPIRRVVPVSGVKTVGADTSQSTRTEIFQGKLDYAKAAGREIVIIKKLGLYAAVTGTYGLYKGSDVIVEEGSEFDGTSFGGDWSKVGSRVITLLPGEELRLYYTDSAADPAGVETAVEGARIKF